MAPNLCGCKSCGGALARYVALRIAERQTVESRLRELRHRLNPDGALAHRNPALDAERSAVWDGERFAHDSAVTHFAERNLWS